MLSIMFVSIGVEATVVTLGITVWYMKVQ